MSPRCPSRRLGPVRTAGVVLAALLAFAAAAPPVGARDGDPNLDQTISAEQPIATDDAVVGAGHVDIGPRFVDGRWTLMVHDDSVATPTWRRLDRTVLRLTDAAIVAVPDDPAYAFVGAAPGEPVHVVSQTQNPDVVWVGWNTQDPEVMQRVDRGATMTLLGVDGPGKVTMYLQSGNFGAPQVLWDSTVAKRQPVWIDVNTHTHANWVFTEPGVYLFHVEIAADLIGGEQVADVADLRFAVGDAARPDDALGASYDGPVADAEPTTSTASDRRSVDAETGIEPLAVVAVVTALVLLIAAVVFVVVRGRTIKRRVDDERAVVGIGGYDHRQPDSQR